ncbi:MAG: DUF3489 domain-containing protein [Robiginitomaculum sp.]|nr:DUF3489 domain-containing protein [Robiginitomaculum sp.]
MNTLHTQISQAHEGQCIKVAPITLKPARIGTKQAQLVALLRRKSGANIEQITQRLGWQAHTARAALTGLRKRGYSIERITKDGKANQYIIREVEAA